MEPVAEIIDGIFPVGQKPYFKDTIEEKFAWLQEDLCMQI